MDKNKIKGTVASAVIAGLVYAIIMSVFYQFFNDEPFNPKKLLVDFLLFAVIVAVISVISHNRRKKK